MFDEPTIKNQQSSTPPSAAGTPSPGEGGEEIATEGTREVGVESSLAQTPPAPAQPTPEVEDMFAAVPEPRETQPMEEAPTMAGAGKKSNFLMISVIGVSVVALLAIGGWYIYNTMMVDTTSDLYEGAVPKIPVEAPEPPIIEEPVEEPVVEEEPVIEEPVIEEEEPVVEEEEEEPAVEEEEEEPVDVDTDGDGLLDSEEQELGTDLFKIDTDDDGLYDREEVQVYKTDPLNPDSDGDGYKDGEEVKAGYDPLGTGKLFEIPT